MLRLLFAFITAVASESEAFQLPFSSPIPALLSNRSYSTRYSSPTPVNPCATSKTFMVCNNQKRTAVVMAAQVASQSWESLKDTSAQQSVGSSLNEEVELRKTGNGAAHVQSKLRLFSSKDDPKITLYRDHAGWCPYCQVRYVFFSQFTLCKLTTILCF